MAGKPQYSDQAKARAYTLLVANDGLVKRTAKELGMPISTLRRWRDDWEKNGPPDLSDVAAEASDILGEMKEVRNLALQEIRARLERGDGTLAQVVTAYGVLTDKIDRVEGVATSVHEHKLTLPSPDELRQALGAFTQHAIEGAVTREEEIVDAEVIERKSLGPGT